MVVYRQLVAVSGDIGKCYKSQVTDTDNTRMPIRSLTFLLQSMSPSNYKGMIRLQKRTSGGCKFQISEHLYWQFSLDQLA